MEFLRVKHNKLIFRVKRGVLLNLQFMPTLIFKNACTDMGIYKDDLSF